jgi:hypothetical protein
MKDQQSEGCIEPVVLEGKSASVGLAYCDPWIAVASAAAATKRGEKSIATISRIVGDCASAKVRLPVPQPTSRIFCSLAIPAKSMNSGASALLQRPISCS